MEGSTWFHSTVRTPGRWCLNLLVLCILVSATGASSTVAAHASEIGIPYYTNYEPKTFNPRIAYQNWAVTQDHHGTIYIANTSGVVEYDGVSWLLLTLPNRSAARSLARDRNNRIFVGGDGTFGYLEADPLGRTRYTDLVSTVPEEERGFADVWTTLATPSGVYFQTFTHLFRWSENQELKIWYPESSFHLSFIVDGALYIREDGIGLKRLVNDRLVKVPGGEWFADERIYAMLPFAPGVALVGTRSRGLFLLDRQGARPFHTEADQYLIDSQLYHGTVLADGTFALATLRGGAVLLDREGRIRQILDRTLGIQSSSVTHVFADSCGGLWLALDRNLSRVEIPASFTVFNEATGVAGAVQSILRHDGRVLVTTTRGVFYLASPPQIPQRPTTVPVFLPIAGVATQCWKLLEVRGGVLVATNDGVFQIHGTRAEQISHEGAFTLLQSQIDPNRVYAGLQDGLSILEWNGARWQVGERIEEVDDRVRTMAEEDDGALWLGVRYQGLLRLSPADSNGGEQAWTVKRFDQSLGLPYGYGRARVYQATGRIYIATDQGIYYYDAAEDHLTLATNLGFAPDLPTSAVTQLREDSDGNLWIVSSAPNGLGVARRIGNTYQMQNAPFRKIQSRRVWEIYPEPDGVVWFGTSSGLIRYDPGVQQSPAPGFHCLMRAVRARQQDVMVPYGVVLTGSPQKLPFKTSELRFEYAAPYPGLEAEIEYQYILDGLDQGWSDWSREVKKEYTRLPIGRYTFQVRARTPIGLRSSIAHYSFKILPPWFRTWWAYLGYLALISCSLALFVRFHVSRATRKERAEAEHRRRVAEMQQARKIQRNMLPSHPPSVPYLDIDAVQRTATEVGGDYYDFFPQPDGTLFVAIGDATGHGIGAGLMVSATKTALLTVSPKDPLPEVANKVNYVLRRVNLGKRLNMALTLIGLFPDRDSDTVNLTAAGGGMAPMFVLRANGTTEEYVVSGVPLGALSQPEYEPVDILLKPDDVLILMSDGLAERKNRDQGLMGYHGVSRCLQEIGQRYHQWPESFHPASIVKQIIQANDDWADGRPVDDDITVVVLKARSLRKPS
jgi:serine phosphatase RsbU (regulator of sigma subunit)/ligand-binding sensor domain-containing protein